MSAPLERVGAALDVDGGEVAVDAGVSRVVVVGHALTPEAARELAYYVTSAANLAELLERDEIARVRWLAERAAAARGGA